MPSYLLEVEHEAQLGPPGPEWRDWRFRVGPKAWKVYMELRHEMYDGVAVDLTLLARRLGMGRGAIVAALHALHEQRLVTFEKDE